MALQSCLPTCSALMKTCLVFLQIKTNFLNRSAHMVVRIQVTIHCAAFFCANQCNHMTVMGRGIISP